MDSFEWRHRLLKAIEDDRRSDRKLSIDAGLGPNYVQQMKNDAKNTGAVAVIKLCSALNVSTAYIFAGIELTPETEEVLKLFSRLDADLKDRILGILRSMRSDGEVL